MQLLCAPRLIHNALVYLIDLLAKVSDSIKHPEYQLTTSPSTIFVINIPKFLAASRRYLVEPVLQSSYIGSHQ